MSYNNNDNDVHINYVYYFLYITVMTQVYIYRNDYETWIFNYTTTSRPTLFIYFLSLMNIFHTKLPCVMYSRLSVVARRWTNFVWMMSHYLRRWANIKTILVGRPVSAGSALPTDKPLGICLSTTRWSNLNNTSLRTTVVFWVFLYNLQTNFCENLNEEWLIRMLDWQNFDWN